MRAYLPNLKHLFIFIIALSVGSLGGCGVGGHCHATSDCRRGLECAGPNEGPSCGIPPRQECEATINCPMGEVCSSTFDACSASGLGSTCAPPCTATSCGDGLRCNPAGVCEPVPCDEGFRCAPHLRCDVASAHQMGAVWSRTSGCVSVDCTGDDDCAMYGGYCVNQRCQQGIGKCVEVMLVP